MKSVPTKGSFFTSIPDKLLPYKTLFLLNNKSMKSQNGKIPVPPQTNITDPAGAMVSYFIPDPIGSDKMMVPFWF